LDRGYRMVELLKQPQYRPLNVVDQVMSIFAGTRGYLDKVPVNRVQEWEEQFLEFVHRRHQAFYDELNTKRDLTDDLQTTLISVIEEFNKTFLA
ncbi:MAG: F0F1 ATP synthase subunit alpha, partial [Planctomycetales bacterium]|nr:F0F1 ATP synthase subunit alpha [Planctomycetales bacterium]